VAEKKRADELLFEKGLTESRERAKRLIMAGLVYVRHDNKDVLIDKPGRSLCRESCIFVKDTERFVSRGGYKLLTALDFFNINVRDNVCLDVGASTGGFTDCLLQHGAQRVYALDVGYGQLHWKLRQDQRVVNLERVNIRTVPSDLLPEKVDLIAADCSFISLSLVLPRAVDFLKSQCPLIALVKPQFEVGPGMTIKGVVKSEALALKAVQDVITKASDELRLEFKGQVPSSIKGPKGNQEYLIYLLKP
jgi:23S rRNA (cytidine1920-2'-O)/16S rRNA (cytidine1409-2'-O)-methyltransferase